MLPFKAYFQTLHWSSIAGRKDVMKITSIKRTRSITVRERQGRAPHGPQLPQGARRRSHQRRSRRGRYNFGLLLRWLAELLRAIIRAFAEIVPAQNIAQISSRPRSSRRTKSAGCHELSSRRSKCKAQTRFSAWPVSGGRGGRSRRRRSQRRRAMETSRLRSRRRATASRSTARHWSARSSGRQLSTKFRFRACIPVASQELLPLSLSWLERSSSHDTQEQWRHRSFLHELR